MVPLFFGIGRFFWCLRMEDGRSYSISCCAWKKNRAKIGWKQNPRHQKIYIRRSYPPTKKGEKRCQTFELTGQNLEEKLVAA